MSIGERAERALQEPADGVQSWRWSQRNTV